jgi:HSP20 family protein
MISRRWPSWESDPYARVAEMRRDMQRLFDAVEGRGGEVRPSGVFPPLNVTEDQDNYYARAELPGVDPSAVELSAQHKTLEIAGERKIATESERASYHRRERVEGRFHRSLSLPADVDAEGIEASYTDGILTIVIPKAEDRKPRQIEVKTS